MEKQETNLEKQDIAVDEQANNKPEDTKPESSEPDKSKPDNNEQQSAVSVDTDSDSDTHREDEQNTKLEWEEKRKEMENRYLRLQADYDNYRKRTQKERSGIIARANKELMLSILPVIDNLERALSHADPEDPFTKGVDMVYKQLVEELKKHGLLAIEAVNQEFDPNYHQAVAKEAADTASGIVLEEYQKGYMLNNEVLRPSMVKVSE